MLNRCRFLSLLGSPLTKLLRSITSVESGYMTTEIRRFGLR
jgi:hypothetical protein